MPKNNDPTAKTPHITWRQFAGAVVAFLISLLFVIIGFRYLLLPEIIVNQTYLTTNCVMTDKRVEQLKTIRGDALRPLYRPSFFVTYKVDNKVYQAWAFDIRREYNNNRLWVHSILDRYQTDQFYTCWYDPKQPSSVVLVKGYSFWAIGFMVMSIGVFLFTAFSLRTRWRQWHSK